MTLWIAVLRGDGIGPEVTEATLLRCQPAVVATPAEQDEPRSYPWGV